MLARLRMLWVVGRDSLWFIPVVLTLLAAVLTVGLVQFEAAYDLSFLEGGAG